jgi:hypothetical protein
MDASKNDKFIFEFNNKGSSSSYYLIYILSGVVTFAAICVFIFTNLNIPLIITTCLAILYFISFHRYKPTFFELLVTNEQLRVNYYSVATALKFYQSVEIALDELKGYETKTKFFGLRKELILTVDSKFGLADYPPISISILKKHELSIILKVLKKIIDKEY